MKFKNLYLIFPLIAGLVAVNGADDFTDVPNHVEVPAVGKHFIPAAKSTETLRVALYPYIPDPFKDNNYNFLERIKKEFNQKYGQDIGVNLEVTMADADKIYDHNGIKELLQLNDVVEIDSLFLGDLKKQELIESWNHELLVDIFANAKQKKEFHNGWIPAAEGVLWVENRVYGIPHWVCGYYFFTRDQRLAEIKKLTELKKYFEQHHPDHPQHIAGDFSGKWDMFVLYLNSYTVQNPTRPPSSKREDWQEIFSLPFLHKQIETIKNIVSIKGIITENEQKVHDDHPAMEFAAGKTLALIGYSERMHIVEQHREDNERIFVEHLPLSLDDTDNGHALHYVDVFVKKKGLTKLQQKAAKLFSLYMNEIDTFEWMVLSEDKKDEHVDESQKSPKPRYLLPARRSAYMGRLKDNMFYSDIAIKLETTVSTPVYGVPRVVTNYSSEIKKEVKI